MLAVVAKEGIVTRALGGFFFVVADQETYRCTVRGALKREQEILVGERVQFNKTGPQSGIIFQVLPRYSQLMRPPVANASKAIAMFAVNRPPPNLFLIDRILVQAEAAGVTIVVCLNKNDLIQRPGEDQELLAPYRRAGYSVYSVSSKTGANIECLQQEFRDCITVLAGQSGVGKSSVLNALEPGLKLATGKISVRSRRGRHTTRQVELLPLSIGGWVIDTPGFSTVDLPNVEPEELVYLFPELGAIAPNCRFADCRHKTEPGCAIRAAVTAGKIIPARFESYLAMVRELRELRRKW
ncbi:MAG TPA: ribosome small subunit-dependent GTPase A [bacterium]|nr:ribosome small subunit-dependent GTPase A [bacterium]